MAICPFAVKRLLPESVTQPRIKPRVFIMHSAAGRGSLYNFFLNSSNLESHFWIANDGTIEQYIDTEVRADANLKANSFAISVETESSPAATEPWTEAQAISLVRLGDWAATTHGIPRVRTPTWDGAGFGWHIMFGAPGPWTPVAKSCPGPARIAQAKSVIIPSIREAGRVLPPVEEAGWTPPPFPGTIRKGSPTERVAVWRVVLGALGYKGFKVGVHPWSMVLGYATKRFQRRHGLKADGIVGPKTWAKAIEVLRSKRAK